MSYIVRVVGYNAYWTGDTEPGKCWSFNINEAQQFDNKEDPQKIVDSGNNMEVVEYASALPEVTNLKASPDINWQVVDEAQKRVDALKAKTTQQEFVDLSPKEFDEDPKDFIEEVDVEVID